jgi:hypothetical protein
MCRLNRPRSCLMALSIVNASPYPSLDPSRPIDDPTRDNGTHPTSGTNPLIPAPSSPPVSQWPRLPALTHAAICAWNPVHPPHFLFLPVSLPCPPTSLSSQFPSPALPPIQAYRIPLSLPGPRRHGSPDRLHSFHTCDTRIRRWCIHMATLSPQDTHSTTHFNDFFFWTGFCFFGYGSVPLYVALNPEFGSCMDFLFFFPTSA